ncbi:Regulator of nonsense transcripts 2 [Smittium culicis]|uniref:Regulator of nonsense transcripts 2 n=1 Tax=Smittium culicis TaxID=133412 RepID=A0A1R1X869_9FUNG|nr:Regulator of nonsense transcripts 2 [Smittium culicis]
MNDDKKDTKQMRLSRLQTVNVSSWKIIDEKSTTKSLDANLKKNTGFIKKCKTNISAEGISALLKDVETLQLKKYLSEIVSAIIEGISKCSLTADVNAAIDLISALHKRFSHNFTVDLISGITKVIIGAYSSASQSINSEQKEKEDLARLSKLKVYFRIITEMYISGLLWGVDSTDNFPDCFDRNSALSGGVSLGSKSDSLKFKEISKTPEYCIVYALLYGLLKNDPSILVNLQLAIHFSKCFKKDFGLSNPTTDSTTAECILQIDSIEIITKDQVSGIKKLLSDYLDSGFSQLKKMISLLKKLETKNKEQLYTKGSISDELKLKYDSWLKQVQKLKSLLQSYSECLGKEMIEIKEESDAPEIGISFDGVNPSSKDEPTSNWWVDDEEKLFYTQILDLRSKVPPILLEFSSKKKLTPQTPNADSKKNPSDTINDLENSADLDPVDVDAIDYEDFLKKRADNVLKQPIVDSFNDAESFEKSSEVKDSLEPDSTMPRLDTLLLQLPTLANRERTDDAAVEYCFSSAKSGHKRIIRSLLDIPRKRQDLIPFYSRFIATLDPFIPTIGAGVVDGLDSEFRWLIRNRIKDLLEVRLRNARYISELTKFRVSPPFKAVRYCKILANNFTPQDIEVLCTILEICGRFLLASPESNPHMLQILEIVQRKKTHLNLDQRHVVLIDSAYLQCFPNLNSQSERVTKKRTVLEEYIRKLIYEKLSKDTYDFVLTQLQKLPWDDKFPLDTCDDLDSQSVHKTLINVFTKSHKVKYSTLPVLAMILELLSKHHPWFRVRVVDTVLENIRLGLESNLFVNNQRRISDVKYLAELYDFRVIDAFEVFETLYLLINFGYDQGGVDKNKIIPFPGRECYFDSPFDYFRIRLVCTILAICGSGFQSEQNKAYLQIFLAFFELYILSKSLPIPLDIKNMVDEIYLKLRPNKGIHDTWNEAAISLEKVIQINQQFIKSKIVDKKNESDNHALKIQAKSLPEDDIKGPVSDTAEPIDGSKTIVVSETAVQDTTSIVENDDENSNSNAEDNDESSESLDEDDENLKEQFGESNPADGSNENSDVVVLRPQQKSEDSWQAIQEAKDFDNELQKMFLESLSSRKLERNTPLDMAIPLQLRDRKTSNVLPLGVSKDSSGSNRPIKQIAGQKYEPIITPASIGDTQENKTGIKFSLLTGKKQKPVIKSLLVPETSSFVLKTRAHQIEAQQEKERLNQLVLNYETQNISTPQSSIINKPISFKRQK